MMALLLALFPTFLTFVYSSKRRNSLDGLVNALRPAPMELVASPKCANSREDDKITGKTFQSHPEGSPQEHSPNAVSPVGSPDRDNSRKRVNMRIRFQSEEKKVIEFEIGSPVENLVSPPSTPTKSILSKRDMIKKFKDAKKFAERTMLNVLKGVYYSEKSATSTLLKSAVPTPVADAFDRCITDSDVAESNVDGTIGEDIIQKVKEIYDPPFYSATEVKALLADLRDGFISNVLTDVAVLYAPVLSKVKKIFCSLDAYNLARLSEDSANRGEYCNDVSKAVWTKLSEEEELGSIMYGQPFDPINDGTGDVCFGTGEILAPSQRKDLENQVRILTSIYLITRELETAYLEFMNDKAFFHRRPDGTSATKALTWLEDDQYANLGKFLLQMKKKQVNTKSSTIFGRTIRDHTSANTNIFAKETTATLMGSNTMLRRLRIKDTAEALDSILEYRKSERRAKIFAFAFTCFLSTSVIAGLHNFGDDGKVDQNASIAVNTLTNLGNCSAISNINCTDDDNAGRNIVSPSETLLSGSLPIIWREMAAAWTVIFYMFFNDGIF